MKSLCLALLLGLLPLAHVEAASAGSAARSVSGDEVRVDLNHAGLSKLCTLPGIGPKRARAIIRYRQKRPFTRITELSRIKGIGLKTVHKLKDRITVHGKRPKGPKTRPKKAAVGQ